MKNKSKDNNGENRGNTKDGAEKSTEESEAL